MTRNTPEILPYCQHCGDFKGVGLCRNPRCDKTRHVDIQSAKTHSNKCPICSKDGVQLCARCSHSYCKTHSIGKEENSLTSIDQHLGTCVICREVICEQCWILNNRGSVTCLAHLESKNQE